MKYGNPTKLRVAECSGKQSRNPVNKHIFFSHKFMICPLMKIFYYNYEEPIASTSAGPDRQCRQNPRRRRAGRLRQRRQHDPTLLLLHAQQLDHPLRLPAGSPTLPLPQLTHPRLPRHLRAVLPPGHADHLPTDGQLQSGSAHSVLHPGANRHH